MLKDQTPGWLLKSGEMGMCPCGCTGKRKKVSFLEKTINDIAKLIKEVIFFEDISFQDGFLQKLDPRVKVISLIILISTATLLHNVFILIIIYLISCILAKISCISLKLYFKRVWLIIPLFTAITVLPSIFNYVRPGNSLISIINFGHKLYLGPFTFPAELAITKQGVSGAILLIVRVGIAVSLAFLFTATTRFANLMKAFRVLFIPKIFITILEMCYRYIFILLNITTDMFVARKSRTLRKIDSKEGRRFVSSAMGSLFGKSYALSEEVYEAMLSRGYKGEPVIMNKFKFTLLDFQWLLGVVICTLTAFGGEIILG
ncbi:cobalt ECF transporter T component CbiQ [Clostridium lacusfryxellense]|uniref:cobalt ECF transporter T component CbiQ n=1 Tax=Clostridium lacusfryxellense TaxID=205328 RepID=UPI001C0ABC16|nr:cobalt ECF transporter T component CbiQ [Clostridium lacusfryxellense]MBU3112798.1 cobalt ECF transporter T component CbiQ [Clostridium lacusfryxellense]